VKTPTPGGAAHGLVAMLSRGEPHAIPFPDQPV
jgi:hypothetical protein